MAAAIIELDALADPVGATAEDDRLLAIGHAGFAFSRAVGAGHLVGRVHVGRLGGELGGAGVDALVDRAHIECAALFRNVLFLKARQPGEAGIREALALQHTEGFGGCRQAVLDDAGLDLHQVADLFEEPRVDFA